MSNGPRFETLNIVIISYVNAEPIWVLRAEKVQLFIIKGEHLY